MTVIRGRAANHRLAARGTDRPALPAAEPPPSGLPPELPATGTARRPERSDAAGGVEPRASGPSARWPARAGLARSVTLTGPAPRPAATLGGQRPRLPERAPVPPELLDRVRDRLVADGGALTAASVTAAVRAEGQVLGDAAVLDVYEALRAESSGAGPLETLLREPTVTDVLVNAPDEVWVDRGAGLEPAPVTFPDERAVRRLAQRLASAAGRRIDDASPYVDARLPDGSRLHAVLAPIARRGTCLSLRVPRRRGFTLAQLVEAGMMPEVGAAWLSAILAARLAFLVTGGTGSGKTTLLSTLLSVVDPSERLILVEDSAELAPAHPHVVRLEARPPNVEGAGQVTVRDLVRQALRMRPDRLVVGEVRGPEVVDLLAALNTGHDGGCGTVHANAAADLPARLEALALAAGMDRAALHSQLAAGVRTVLHLERTPSGARRLAEICVLRREPDGLVATRPAVLFPADAPPVEGPALSELSGLVSRRGV